MRKERGSRCDHNKEGDGIGKNSPHVDLEAFIFIIAHTDAFINNGALHVQLHIGADGGACSSDQRQDIAAVQLNGGNDGSGQYLSPVRFREKGGDDIGKKGEGQGEEDLLDARVGAASNEQPDQYAASRGGNPAGNAKKAERGSNADKFRDNDSTVCDQEDQHNKGRQSQGKVFAN